MPKMLQHFQEWKPVDVAGERDVYTMSEAAKRIGISAGALAELCLRGRLTWLRDERESNVQKQGRVLVKDVEQEIARRRSEAGRADGRLKVKRGRPVGT
jgi:hypothetical protein